MLTIEANTKASCVTLRSNSPPVAPVPSMCLPCAFSEVQCHLSPLFTTQSLLLFYPGDLVFNWVSVLNWQKPIETCNLFFWREVLDVFFTFISPPICRSICAAAEIKGLGRVSAAGPHRAAPPAYSRLGQQRVGFQNTR